MVKGLKPGNFPDEQSKMGYAFNRLKGIALGQILPHIQEDRTKGQEHPPAVMQRLEKAFEDPDCVATAERKIRDIKQRSVSTLSTMLSFK
jgi:hypothetical protein